MDPRGTVGRIYKEEHYILLLTKYESSGPCGFGAEDFFMFYPRHPPPGRGLYEPQGHGWQDLSRGPLYIATDKIRKLWALWFQRRRFFYVFPIVSLWELMTPGAGPFLTPGA